MYKPLLIIKLGGSVITFKDSFPPKANLESITALTEQIIKLAKEYRIILIHGAGSFAHHTSKHYSLPSGIANFNQVIGTSITTTNLIGLHHIILKSLVEKNIAAIGLPPHAFIKKNGKVLELIDLNFIRKYLDQNFVPVLYGDVVLDDIQGCAILSGDEIMTYFGKSLHAKNVIFVSDVDGIFSDNPKVNSKAELIREIDKQNITSVLSSFRPHNVNDVTGEMYGKLKNIVDHLSNQEVFIVNGFTKGILTDLVLLNKPLGTKIMLS